VTARIRVHVHSFHYGCYEELEGNPQNIFGRPPYRLCRFNKNQMRIPFWVFLFSAIGTGIATVVFFIRGADPNDTLLALFGFISLTLIVIYIKRQLKLFDQHAKEGLDRFESKLPE